MKQLPKVLTGILPMVVLLSGCAPVKRFRPAPLSPRDSATRLESRSLSDLGLKEFVEKNLGRRLGPWPPRSWDVSTLTLAAFYFRCSPMMTQPAIAPTAGSRLSNMPNVCLGRRFSANISREYGMALESTA